MTMSYRKGITSFYRRQGRSRNNFASGDTKAITVTLAAPQTRAGLEQVIIGITVVGARYATPDWLAGGFPPHGG